MSSYGDSDDDGKSHLFKLNPSKIQTVSKYALFYSFVIAIKISGEFCTFVLLFILWYLVICMYVCMDVCMDGWMDG